MGRSDRRLGGRTALGNDSLPILSRDDMPAKTALGRASSRGTPAPQGPSMASSCARSPCIRRAQEAGEISQAQDSQKLAHFIVASINGIRSAGRVEREREHLMDLVELTLSVVH